jgi:hypothetical protein
MTPRPIAAGFFVAVALTISAGVLLTVIVVAAHFINKFW